MKLVAPHASLIEQTAYVLAIFAVATLPVYFIAAWTIDRIGRKLMQTGGFLLIGLAFFLLWAIPGATTTVGLFLVLFGVGDETKISVAAFGAILVILFNVAYGVMNARKTRLLAAKVMGASRLRVLFDVMLLESLPQTFVGLRNGVSLALVIIVVAEMFIGSQDGLGHSVFEAQQLFDMPRMYAAIFAAGALGYGLNLFFLVIERQFVHWSGK